MNERVSTAENSRPVRVVVTGRPTRDPNDDVVGAFVGAFGKHIAPIETAQLADDLHPARIEFACAGGTVMADIDSGWFHSFTRREHSDHTRPGLIVAVALDGQLDVSQDGRRGVQSAGEIAMVHTQAPFDVHAPGRQKSRLLLLPDTLLRPLVGDVASLAGMHLPAGVAEFNLLRTYLASLGPADFVASNAMATMATRQLADLLAAGLARTWRREDPTEGRGVRSVRLHKIFRIVEENLASQLLNAERVGRQIGVTGRYVQMLMEGHGTTFSAYVMEKRLERALSMLRDPAFGGETVARIGELAGFADPTHFSRAFRRRFGETPGGVRSRHSGEPLALPGPEGD